MINIVYYMQLMNVVRSNMFTVNDEFHIVEILNQTAAAFMV